MLSVRGEFVHAHQPQFCVSICCYNSMGCALRQKVNVTPMSPITLCFLSGTKVSNFILLSGNRRSWKTPVLPRKLVVSVLLSRQCSICLSWFSGKHFCGSHGPLMKTDLLVFITECPFWSPGSCWCSVQCSKAFDFSWFCVPCLLEVFCC